MKLNAVGVISSQLNKTVEFYSLLGFEFDEYDEGTQHLEPKIIPNSARLMIDTIDLAKDLIGQEPCVSNHSAFAIQYDTPAEVNTTAEKIQAAGFTLVKEPWDAFWGQRYCTIQDPDGYKVDLYASLEV